VTDAGWIETYRGTVFRWEVDTVDHFTVAYYFDRFEQARRGLLEALDLVPTNREPERRACIPVDCYVRYLRELRAGDILHVLSGVIDVGDTGLTVGHKLFDSETGTVCATLEQRLAHVQLGDRAAVPLAARARRAAEARRITWDGPAREPRREPKGLDGFVDTVRDTVQLGEVTLEGECGLEHYVHRFSAANAQVMAAIGFSPAYMREQRRGFSTFEFQLALPGALRAGDPVLVKTAIVHVGNSSLHLCHKLSHARSGRVVATLHQLGVHLDLAARRPTALPEAIRAKTVALLAPAS
jgi:acyl-CoA thioester hydrolase